MLRTLWYVKPGLIVHAADPVIGIGLHELAVLAPVLPEEDVHQDAVHRTGALHRVGALHRAGALLCFEQLRHPLGDELHRVDRTPPEVTAIFTKNGNNLCTVPKIDDDRSFSRF